MCITIVLVTLYVHIRRKPFTNSAFRAERAHPDTTQEGRNISEYMRARRRSRRPRVTHVLVSNSAIFVPVRFQSPLLSSNPHTHFVQSYTLSPGCCTCSHFAGAAASEQSVSHLLLPYSAGMIQYTLGHLLVLQKIKMFSYHMISTPYPTPVHDRYTYTSKYYTMMCTDPCTCCIISKYKLHKNKMQDLYTAKYARIR